MFFAALLDLLGASPLWVPVFGLEWFAVLGWLNCSVVVAVEGFVFEVLWGC